MSSIGGLILNYSQYSNDNWISRVENCILNMTFIFVVLFLQNAVFAEVLEQVKENLTPERGEAYCTAIVALGHIAFHLPEKFPVHIKNIVSRKIVKELIMKDQSEVGYTNHLNSGVRYSDSYCT